MEATNINYANELTNEKPTTIPSFFYQYNFRNLNYEIELFTYNSILHIKATNKSELEGFFYLYEEPLENIYKLDRYFLVFQTIEEIKNYIIEILNENEKKNIELREINDNELKIVIKVMKGRKGKLK